MLNKSAIKNFVEWILSVCYVLCVVIVVVIGLVALEYGKLVSFFYIFLVVPLIAWGWLSSIDPASRLLERYFSEDRVPTPTVLPSTENE